MLQLLLMRRELDVADDLELAREKGASLRSLLKGRQTDFGRTPDALAIWRRAKHLRDGDRRRAGFAWTEPPRIRKTITRLIGLHDVSGKIERT